MLAILELRRIVDNARDHGFNVCVIGYFPSRDIYPRHLCDAILDSCRKCKYDDKLYS